MLCYVWEDARVWAHWNHSFDMHLSYLGPVSCVFSSWVSSGCTFGDGCSGWLLDGLGSGQPICLHPEFPQGSLSGGGCNVMAWWLQHPLFTDMAGNILVLMPTSMSISWCSSSSGLQCTKPIPALGTRSLPRFSLRLVPSCHSALRSVVTSSEKLPLITNSQVTTHWSLSHSLFFCPSPGCF